MLDDVDEPALSDLEGHEREDVVAECLQVDVGGEAGDDTAPLQLLEPRLYRPTSDFESAGQLHHPSARSLGDGFEEAGVESVDPSRFHRADRLADLCRAVQDVQGSTG